MHETLYRLRHTINLIESLQDNLTIYNIYLIDENDRETIKYNKKLWQTLNKANEKYKKIKEQKYAKNKN